LSAERDAFSVSEIRVAPTAPAVGIPDAGSAQAIALEMVLARGWDMTEFSCLVALWTRESNWNAYSHNSSSGAYGIPQALPGEKMASAGDDWATNPATQITWGLGYITDRYGTPCGAWGHSEEKGWY
ncbi:MAG: transglycosylase SLT domain-containing protein, partial [Microbacteriaceae bacterium]|nr:transglycosylase SLT domain-containing protein [Microbacteriaceae bacterium]